MSYRGKQLLEVFFTNRRTKCWLWKMLLWAILNIGLCIRLYCAELAQTSSCGTRLQKNPVSFFIAEARSNSCQFKNISDVKNYVIPTIKEHFEIVFSPTWCSSITTSTGEAISFKTELFQNKQLQIIIIIGFFKFSNMSLSVSVPIL